MSGGYFDYNQYRIDDIIDQIERAINANKETYDFSAKTIREFRKAIRILRKGAVYAQRIDWLISGDDGEETFHKRLKEDLEGL